MHREAILSANPNLPLAGNVPGSYVRLLFEHLERLEVSVGDVLGEAMPPLGPEQTYRAEHWRRLLTLAAIHLNDPVLGVRIGASITPAHLGPLGYVLLASSSAAAAMERYVKYQRLVHDVSPVRQYFDGQSVVLEWGDDSRAIGLLANQCGLASLVQFARNITGADVVPDSVHFVEPEPDDPAPYEHFFGCPVLFGQSATRIRFPAAVLGMPLRQPDPGLVQMLEAQVQASAAALPNMSDLLEDIRRLMSRHLFSGDAALELVARELHISGRTLRRRLAESGWNFRGLLESIRQRMAEDYLRDARLTLPEVALLLGYSEQSAFNRAFRRWTGMTPKRWRSAAGESPAHVHTGDAR